MNLINSLLRCVCVDGDDEELSHERYKHLYVRHQSFNPHA